MVNRPRTFLAAASAAAILGSVFLTATPASATAGSCKAGDACLYYNSGYGGSKYGISGPVSDYAPYKFKGGNANGQRLKNNVASVRNMSTSLTLTVFYNNTYNCKYACQKFPPGSKANLNSKMKNENASQLMNTGLDLSHKPI